jgi:large subunit ribosomal protein L13
MKTYALKAKDVTQTWHVVDAAGRPLGRVASEVAAILRGKQWPTFQPSMSNGDHVIVVNAAKVTVSGDTREKKYYRHTMYPGGLRSVTQEKLLATKPAKVVEAAVKGMLPRGAHGAKLLRYLRVYPGPTHPHAAQVNAGAGKRSSATAGAEKARSAAAEE